MLVALDENLERTYADFSQKTDKYGNKNVFYCPECGSKLILRQGTKNIWHFAHADDNGVCVFRKGGGESIIHQTMKYVIKKIIERDNECVVSELEWKIGSRIADYYFETYDKFNNKKRVVVECVHQHTDIDTFREKCKYYSKKGVFVLWVFNLNRFLNKDNSFKDEIRINEILKECHTMYYGKVYAIDLNNEIMYGIHFNGVWRYVEEDSFIDWSSWNRDCDPEEYISTHTRYVGGYDKYLKDTKEPLPKLIKCFLINSFKKAWDKQSLKFLPYRRNVANMYLENWW